VLPRIKWKIPFGSGVFIGLMGCTSVKVIAVASGFFGVFYGPFFTSEGCDFRRAGFYGLVMIFSVVGSSFAGAIGGVLGKVLSVAYEKIGIKL
jgi:hypothetical protein